MHSPPLATYARGFPDDRLQGFAFRLHTCCETYNLFGRSPNCAGLPRRVNPHPGSTEQMTDVRPPAKYQQTPEVP